MTNEEYIKIKKTKKFEQAWEKRTKLLPGRNQTAIEIAGQNIDEKYLFKKQISNGGAIEIICQKSIRNPDSGNWRTGNRRIYSKKDFQEIFVDFEGYEREVSRIRYVALYENKSEEQEVQEEYSDYNESIILEKEYAQFFLAWLSCDCNYEKKCDRIQLIDLPEFINSYRQTKSLASRYFEYKKIKAKSIKPYLNQEIRKVIVQPKNEKFIELCQRYGLRDLRDLMFFPYHAKCVVSYLGWELLENVIKEVIQYLKFEKLWSTVTAEDLRG